MTSRSDDDGQRAAGPRGDANAETTIVHDVGAAHAGQRLDVVLADVAGISRSRAARHVDDESVTVDEVVRPRSHRVGPGERIRFTPPAPTPPRPPPPMPHVVVADDDFLVVDKPAGLVVHPGHGNPDGTLADALRAFGIVDVGPDPARPGIVHRLDKDTSGLMVVARSDRAYAALVDALRARTMTRGYLALVAGSLPGTHGVIDVPLGRDERDRTRFAARSDGRDAVTHFRTIATGTMGAGTVAANRGRMTLVACRLETGRTHQIRVHMAHVGTPVVGDITYGASPSVAAALGLDRMFLHAAHLRLSHPSTGLDVTATCPLPHALAEALRRVGIDPDGDVTWP